MVGEIMRHDRQAKQRCAEVMRLAGFSIALSVVALVASEALARRSGYGRAGGQGAHVL